MTLLLETVRSFAPSANKRSDERFEALMGAAAWHALAPDVQRRFSNKATGGQSIVFKGVVSETRLKWSGWLLAQMCRLIGAPLPLEADTVGMPAVVSVTEDADGKGQFWTRTYGRKRGFPQVIHSSKRFDGPTGLEEYVGCGISMPLEVTEENGGIVFTSAGYYWHGLGIRIRIPEAFMPGVTKVSHDDLGDGYFAFTLSVKHPVLGEHIYQRVIFSDTGPRVRK